MHIHRSNNPAKGLVLGAITALTIMASPASANADPLLLSEITVVSITLDTKAEQREVKAAGEKQALKLIREQLDTDIEAHIDETSPDAPKRIAGAKANRSAG